MSIKFVQVYQREEKDFKLAHVNLFTHTQWLCVPCVRNFDAVTPVGVIRGQYKRTHIPRTRLIRHLDYIWYGQRTLSIQLDKKEWFTEFWILGGKFTISLDNSKSQFGLPRPRKGPSEKRKRLKSGSEAVQWALVAKVYHR